MAKLTSIRNIGAKLALYLENAGFSSAETLREAGHETAMLRLLQNGHGNHILYYQALRLGLMGRAWNDVDEDEKAQFKAEFAAIQDKAKNTFQQSHKNDLPPTLEQALREIGVK